MATSSRPPAGADHVELGLVGIEAAGEFMRGEGIGRIAHFGIDFGAWWLLQTLWGAGWALLALVGAAVLASVVRRVSLEHRLVTLVFGRARGLIAAPLVGYGLERFVRPAWDLAAADGFASDDVSVLLRVVLVVSFMGLTITFVPSRWILGGPLSVATLMSDQALVRAGFRCGYVALSWVAFAGLLTGHPEGVAILVLVPIGEGLLAASQVQRTTTPEEP